MCTVTLRCGAGALLLTMNRDERYERAPEEAPRRIPGEPGARELWWVDLPMEAGYSAALAALRPILRVALRELDSAACAALT